MFRPTSLSSVFRFFSPVRHRRSRRAAGAGLVLLLSFGHAAWAGHAGPGDPSNPANPWDEVGRLHNALLDHAVGAREVVGDRPAPLAAAIVGRALEFAADSAAQPCPAGPLDLDVIASLVADPDDVLQLLSVSLTAQQLAHYAHLATSSPGWQTMPPRQVTS